MKWISVDSRLPESEEEVLVCCDRNGYKFVCPAIYEDGTVSAEDSKWSWYDLYFEYDEENDKYMIPDGWWEKRQFNSDDVYNHQIDCSITHWMPLPESPDKHTDENIQKIPVTCAHWSLTRHYITTADDEMHFYECSICGKYSLEDGRYCPHCGAKMDE